MQRASRSWVLVLVIATMMISVSPLAHAHVSAQTEPPSIIFMHHSTGLGVIEQGGVREAFTDLGYAFWDHGYNDEGLVDPGGDYLGVNWDVPGDNTDPDGWYAIFTQPVTDPPSNTFSHMLQHDVIIFKSCFPSSNITDDAMFEQYQRYYLAIRGVIDQHPDKLFIPFTTPPLVPNETDAESAARARRWAEYLTSDEYLAGHPNIAVFDFFNLLADDDGFLRAEYRGDEWDSHPNDVANGFAGPQLVEFVDAAVRAFEPGLTPQPEALSTEEADTVPDEDAGSAGLKVTAEIDALDAVLQVETDVLGLWDYTNDPVTAFSCGVVAEGREDDAALALIFDIQPEGTAGCGFDLAPQPEWVNAQGIMFWVRADMPDQVLRVALGVREADQTEGEAAPFDVELTITDTEWTLIIVRWDDLQKAEWYGDMGADAFDPAQVAWLAFDVGYWELPQVGTFWIDDVTLLYD